MLKLVVHDAIIQPTGVKCRIGQRVQLNEPAARRLEARNRSSIHNLTWDPLNTGTVKAVREGGRVRVQTEDGKMVWHDTANLVPLGLGPTSPAVGLSPREHDEKDKVDWEDVERQAKNIDVRISAFLRMFEVHDYQNDDVRVMTYDEFHEGLIRFHKFCELQAEPGVEQELPHAVYVADEAVRAMLLLLAYDNPKGRDKKWQDDMLHMIFVSMDEDMDHSLSQGEFCERTRNHATPSIVDCDSHDVSERVRVLVCVKTTASSIRSSVARMIWKSTFRQRNCRTRTCAGSPRWRR